MPFNILCPNCQRAGTLPDSFRGGKVRCPSCQTIHAVAHPSASSAGSRTAPAASSTTPRKSPASSSWDTSLNRSATAPAPQTSPPPSPTPPPPPPAYVQAPRPVASPAAWASAPGQARIATPPPPGPSPTELLGARRRHEEPERSGISPAVIGLIAAGGVFGTLLVVAAVALRSAGTSQEPKVVKVDNVPTQEIPSPAPAIVEAIEVPSATPTIPAYSTPPAPTPVFASSTVTPPPPTPVATAASTEFRQGAPSFHQATSRETPAETVKRIKDAAVFIKVKAGDEGGSGSGFVIRVEGTNGLIATNHHVIGLGKEDDEPDPQAPSAEVTVVFRSGTPQQRAVPARIIATDRVGNRDLAILRVEGVPDLPKPIAIDQKPELTETQPVLIYGFPFGEMDKMLSTHANVASPGITINKGSISSLRRNEHGEVTYVQIDGSLNPGNSGGPVVDDQGRLVGVAVAQIRNTTIGFAVPAVELTRMLDGRVGRLRMKLASRESSLFNLDVKARLIDPMKRIRSVQFLHGRLDPNHRVAPNPDGSWSPLSGAQSLTLTVGAEQAGGQTLPIATGVFQVIANVPNDRKLMIQLAHTDTNGRTTYAAPEEFEVPEKPGEINTPNGTVQGDVILAAEGLAEITNSKDCTSSRDRKSVTISVPGTVHLLSPELKKKNAPMMLGEIEGDFVARVKVAGEFRPGTESAGKLPLAFHGAGLLLWQDNNNYVRLERTAGTTRSSPVLLTRILVEVCSNGKPTAPFYMPVPEGPLYLQFVRIHSDLYCMFGPDGQKWISLQKLAAEFPDKVKVGLTAANTSKKAFAAKFEEFKVIKPTGKVEGTDE